MSDPLDLLEGLRAILDPQREREEAVALGVLLDRATNDSTEPRDLHQALALLQTAQQDREKLAAAMKQAGGEQSLVGAVLMQAESVSRLEDTIRETLIPFGHFASALAKFVEAISNRWIIGLIVLLLAGSAGVITFQKVALDIPGLVAPVSDTPAPAPVPIPDPAPAAIEAQYGQDE